MRSHLSPRPVLGTVWNKDYLAHNYLKYWLKSRLLSLPQSKEIRSDGARIMRFSWSVTSRYFQSNLKAIWSLFFSGSYAYFGLTASKLRRGRGSRQGNSVAFEHFKNSLFWGNGSRRTKEGGSDFRRSNEILWENSSWRKKQTEIQHEFKQLMLETEVGASSL